MATIARLVTQLAADPAPMEAGLARGIQLIQQFAEKGANILTNIAPKGNSVTAAEAGAAVATNFVSALEKQFSAQEGQLREAFARGSLNKSAWEEQGKENAAAFNRALLNGIGELRNSKTALPPEVFTELQDSLKEEGIKASDAFTNSFTTIGTKFRSLGRDLTQTGRELTIALTIPITAAAITAVAAANTFTHAVEEIGIVTGKTGPQFEALAGNLHRLFDALPNSAQDIAKALEIISTATDASGGQLDALATQVLNLSRITGTDLRSNVESTQAAFKQFGVAAHDQEAGLNTLFRTAQLTGATVSQLADTIAHFAPVLHEMGLSFGQSAALVGTFAKSGIEVDGVLTALQTSLSRFAERGVDGVHAIDIIINDIKNASTTAKAVDLASDIFGPRQASQLTDAIRSGKLDIQGLANLVRATAVDINAIAGETDKFGQALDDLRHHLTDSSAILGQQFEEAVVKLAPLMIAIADKLVELAQGFNSLRPSVQIAVGAFVALLAAIGPALLLLGGLSKAIGATALAVGILKAGLSNFSLAPLVASATSATEELSAAAAAAATMAAALRLLLIAGGITAVLVGLSIIFDAIGEAAERANKQVKDFKTGIAALNETQLKLQDDQISAQIELNVREIEKLKQHYDEVKAKGELTFKFIAKNKSDTDALNDANGILLRDLNAITDAEKRLADEAATAHQRMDDFTKLMDSLITSGGTSPNIKIDAVGHISASVDVLQARIKALDELIHHPRELGTIDIKVAQAALEALQHALAEAQDKGKGIAPIFDKLHTPVKLFTEEISGLIARIQDLGPTQVQQLGNIKLNRDVVNDLVEVNRQLAALPAFAAADRAALEAAQKALQGLAAVQLTQNLPNSADVKVSVTGVIKRLVPDTSLDSSTNFIEMEELGLGRVQQAAENASAAAAHLQEVLDSHAGIDAVTAAQNAVAQAYERLNIEERDFRAQVDKTNKSLTDRNAAKALINPVVTGAGANTAEVKPDAKSADTAAFMKTLQAQIDLLPGLTIKLVPVQEFKDLHDLATKIGQEVQAAQLEALAGNAGAARAAQQKLVDDFAKRVKQTALDTAGTSLEQQSVAFQQIAADAAKANVPIADILKHMKDLSAIGKTITIADSFKAAADAAFGANSAIASFAGGLDEAVKAADKLSDTLDTIRHGGSFGDNFADLFSGLTQGITGLVSAVGGIIKGISGLTKDPLAQEHDKILTDNTNALAKLSQTLDRQAGTPGRLDEVIKAFFAANTFNEQNNPGNDPSKSVFASQQALTEFLKSTNITFEQLNEEAKALGITFVDSKGNLVGLDAAFEAFNKEAKILTTLGDDFSTQQAKIAAENAIAGKSTADAAQTLTDQLKAITATAPDLGAALEAANTQGPEALRKALANLVASIENGTVTLDQLHGFKDVNELLNAVTSAADDLNKLGDTAAGVTEQLVGVPQGFKLALAEFNATAAQSSFNPPTPKPAPPPTDTTPARPPDTGALADLVKQLTDAIKAQPLTPTPTPTPITPPGVVLDTHALTNVEDALKALIQSGGDSSKAVSDVKDALAALPLSALGSATSLTALATQLASDLPNAASVAKTALDGIISGLANASVTVPAPVFHVEQSSPLTLPAPTVTFSIAPPVALAPPTITFGQFAPLSIPAPKLTVGPFASVTLAPPPVTVLPFAPLTLDPPVVTVGDIKPVVATPPTVTLASAIPTVSAAPPLVSLSRNLATVVVGPPPVVVSPYKSNVALSPPSVTVGQFPTVMLAAPPITVSRPNTVSMAAPAFHVQPFQAIRLDGPPVSIAAFKPIQLAAPKVTVDPLPPIHRVDSPIIHDPVATLPASTKDVSTSDDKRLLAQLVDLLMASAQAPATGDTIFTGDINIDAQKQTRKEIFEAAKAEAQAISRATTGTTLNVLSAFQR